MTIAETAQARKRHGKHYTPVELADFLASRTFAHVKAVGHIRVLDPACGDGELLLAAHREALKLGIENVLELVGYELDPAAVVLARTRAAAAGVEMWVEEGDFLRISRELKPNSIDVVITNPPYVRTQQLGQVTAQALAREFGLTGRVDLTHPFVSVLPKLLRPHGVLSLLCSNRFMTTKAGANVRRVFQTVMTPVEVFDLGDTRLFDAAVLPAVVVARKEKLDAIADCHYSSAYEDAATEPDTELSLFDALVAERDSTLECAGRVIRVKIGRLAHSENSADPWRLAQGAGQEWLTSVQASTWSTFGEVAKIRVGIKTTADAVFIRQDWARSCPEPEAELLMPLITNDDVGAWSVKETPSTRVLYPYDRTRSKRTLVDMEKFPKAMAYLNSHGERLKGRKYVVEGGREWFEIWVPQRPDAWSKPKIVFPDISTAGQFALDASGAVVNGDCYWISLADIGSEDLAYLMLAVANSSLGQRYYDEVCGNKLYGGKRRWMTQYVARLPIPYPDSKSARALVNVARELVASDHCSHELLIKLDELVAVAFMEPSLDAAPRHKDAMLF